MLKCGGKPVERLLGVKLHSGLVRFIQFTPKSLASYHLLPEKLQKKTGFHFVDFTLLPHPTVSPEQIIIIF